ncbi:sugar transferase [Cryobacterium sp. TMT1-21]|uniref:sugar transferase n=1 Tax=Cryobacterium sp. TMT1-21 TaxID=1259234 RepID=UPI00106A8B2F|nr:sugar transferase [Cryobacterium sp. TMT1-21]TFD17435.1 sugar transferase [Cryobacterium sp. TMT1-21]
MNEKAASQEASVGQIIKVRDWRTVYASRLAITDLLVLIWVVLGVQILWFGLDTADLAFRGSTTELNLSYSAVSLLLIACWMAMLHIYGSRGYRVLGTGPDEYKLIASASMRLFGLLAIVAYLFHIDVARGYILIAFPMGITVLVFSRWIWRQWLVVQRLRGTYSSRVVLVGSMASASRVHQELTRFPGAGYLVVGACVPGGQVGDRLAGTSIPVLGGVHGVELLLKSVNADTVVVTSSADFSPDKMRQLSWSLEPGRHHLVVAPSLTDIGGPRIHTRPVAGLPLIHVETPRYDGRTLFTKRAFDFLASGLIIVLLSPALVLIALAIRLSKTGPVLFRQARVGINGKHFTMLKFRSMVIDAETRWASLGEQQPGVGNSVLFKMKNDPRVTPLGHFLRRFSLDELPQLFNVFGGSMSLVGPRPPLEREVEQYESHVHRRFLVKPGITGLWQISGRSNLSWEDSVRLDLYYVENWSIMGDLIILWRTTKAVLGSHGAY